MVVAAAHTSMVSFTVLISIVVYESPVITSMSEESAKTVGQIIERSLVGNLWGSQIAVWARLISDALFEWSKELPENVASIVTNDNGFTLETLCSIH